MESKKCSMCGEMKELDCFYKQDAGKFGRAAQCKPCNRIRIRTWRRKNSVRENAKSRKRNKKNKEINAAKRKNDNEAVRLREKARERVRDAIRSGDLVRLPCRECWSEHNVHAHHENYDSPLSVTWLCPVHHAERHRQIRLINLFKLSE